MNGKWQLSLSYATTGQMSNSVSPPGLTLLDWLTHTSVNRVGPIVLLRQGTDLLSLVLQQCVCGGFILTTTGPTLPSASGINGKGKNILLYIFVLVLDLQEKF